jgi:hypothetical protein
MHVPDVCGFRLENASEILTSAGFDKIVVHTTAAPRLRDSGYDGNSRVVRQEISADNVIELLVCNIHIK